MFDLLIYCFDLAGTVIFAVTGAVSAVKLRLDLLGVAVFSCTVGVGGGMLRDTIIGATPAAALQNEVYLIACILTGLVLFFISGRIARHGEIIMYCDAFGLGVFTAIGAAKGSQYDLGPVGIMLCATLSAVGGGILRDVHFGAKHQRCKAPGRRLLKHVRVNHAISLFHGKHGNSGS